jgi:hypothetical protein
LVAFAVHCCIPPTIAGPELIYIPPAFSCVRAAAIEFAREGSFMDFAGFGAPSAAHFTRGAPIDLRERIRRRAALRDRLILLGLIVALVVATFFGVTLL